MDVRGKFLLKQPGWVTVRGVESELVSSNDSLICSENTGKSEYPDGFREGRDVHDATLQDA